jgi:chromosome segregation ATPase
MATTAERLGVVETKVANLDEKLDEIKVDVKDMHDCLDKTRDSVMAKLEDMYGASCQQHSELASKITELEKFRQKWIYMTAGGVAVLGWVSGHMDLVAKIFN